MRARNGFGEQVPTIFRKYMSEIRFAALSVDGLGLWNYGECSWVLRDDMIAHRTSVFEENSVMFMERQGIALSKAHKLPPGHRAPWDSRAKLCVAKLAARINNETTTKEHGELLMRQGASTEDDEYVEVHVGGPVTARTFQKVIVNKELARTKAGKALREKLAKLGVGWEAKSWTH